MAGNTILNLGAGELPIKGAVNVDGYKGKYIDDLVDLSVFPWKWKDSSVEGIYMIHSLEHFPDAFQVLNECHRILKKDGFLYIQVPHSSLAGGIGCLGHYRTFGFNTFSSFLSQSYYVYSTPLFKTVIEEVRWWNIPRNRKHPYVEFAVENKDSGSKLYFLIKLAAWFIQKLINLSPRFFERFWCYWVGGADEVIWKGIKL